MKISNYYDLAQTTISFELFPPRTDKSARDLEERLPRLISLEPSFITVTYGAFGSDQNRTLEIASKIRNEYQVDVAHHMTCVSSSKEDIDQLLAQIKENNIDNIVALRGDKPETSNIFSPPENGFSHANELVAYIREYGDFGLAVAGYPEKHIEAEDFETDLFYLKKKVDAGADVIITQLYYDNDHFYDFLTKCRDIGIDVPIIPGLMPILNLEQIKRITRICGATIPRDLLAKLEDAKDDPDKLHEVGIEHTTNQALNLIQNGVTGIHFYVLNRYFHIAEIMERIKPALQN